METTTHGLPADLAGSELTPPPPPPAPLPPRRLGALDAFRGLTVLAMLLVNNLALGDNAPDVLIHASWGQAPTLTDLVFPWFLLAVGIAQPLAAASHVRRGGHWPTWALKSIGRTVGLFLIGCFLDSCLIHGPILSMGVLQLIALAGLVGALLVRLPLLARLAAVVALWFFYTKLLLSQPLTETTGAVQALSARYLAPWRPLPAVMPYGMTGLLSVIPTAGLVLAGGLLGELLRAPLRSYNKQAVSLRGLVPIALGPVLAALGIVAQAYVPMSKTLWTPSYLLYAGGLGCLVQGILTVAIDLPPLGRWSFWSWPLRAAGANALIAYAAPIAVKGCVLRVWQWQGVPLENALRDACIARYGHDRGGWIWSLGYVGVWWLVLLYLYARRIFVRL